VSIYIVAFSDVHALAEVRTGVTAAIQDVPEVELERTWAQPGDPGEYIALRAGEPDRVRQVLSGTELVVEGFAELRSVADIAQLSVYRPHLIVDVSGVLDYAPGELMWCDRCRDAHRPGEHAR
jgi:hypothetical protein